MNTTVRQLLKQKDDAIWAVGSKTTIYDALQKMADKDIGALLVIDNDETVGIFSERDFARNALRDEMRIKETTVGELMTRDVLYLKPEDSVWDCMGLMTAKRIRHLPVIEQGKVIGIITIGDVVKQVISNQESTIQDLERYIRGG